MVITAKPRQPDPGPGELSALAQIRDLPAKPRGISLLPTQLAAEIFSRQEPTTSVHGPANEQLQFFVTVRQRWSGALRPIAPVEGAVIEGFSQTDRPDWVVRVEVRDGAAGADLNGGSRSRSMSQRCRFSGESGRRLTFGPVVGAKRAQEV
jgi:hypothetical protein